jgi:hypothetical protein
MTDNPTERKTTMISLTKLAADADLCVRTVTRDIAKGVGPKVQYVGRCAVFTEADAAEYIERRRRVT